MQTNNQAEEVREPRNFEQAFVDASGGLIVHIPVGKTTAAVNELIKQACIHRSTRNWYVTNDYRQAKRNVWEELKRYIPKELKPVYNNSELSVYFPYSDSKIELIGVENADSLRGAVVHFMILDEYAK